MYLHNKVWLGWRSKSRRLAEPQVRDLSLTLSQVKKKFNPIRMSSLSLAHRNEQTSQLYQCGVMIWRVAFYVHIVLAIAIGILYQYSLNDARHSQEPAIMVVKKRCLLWDWTNTAHVPDSIEAINFMGPLSSVANWNAWTPPELKNRLPFRPTVRGLSQLTDPHEWSMISINDHAIMHYFNEPERAGISPQHAAELWKEKMLPLRKGQGKKLVGPGCASDPGGEAWLDDFMGRISGHGEQPDYLGVHYYGADGDSAIAYIEKM